MRVEAEAEAEADASGGGDAAAECSDGWEERSLMQRTTQTRKDTAQGQSLVQVQHDETTAEEEQTKRLPEASQFAVFATGTKKYISTNHTATFVKHN